MPDKPRMSDFARSFAQDEDPDRRRAIQLAWLTFAVPILATMTALLTATVLVGVWLVGTLWAESKWNEKRFRELEAKIERLESKGATDGL
jgi:hypothetical protein